MGGCSKACLHAAGRRAMRGWPPATRAPAALQAPPTSAWPPDVRVFPHFSHFKQGRCQSFPREVTRSAAEAQTVPPTQYKTLLWGHRAQPPAHSSLLQFALPLVSPRAPGGLPRVSALCRISGWGGTSSPLGQPGQRNGRGRGVVLQEGAGARMTRGAVAGGACRAPFSGGGGGRDTSHFLPWVGPGAQDREAAPGSERARDRAPGAAVSVCFCLAMGGAARALRVSLRRAVPARGAPRGDGRAGETQRRGHLKKGGPGQAETQRDRQEETAGRRPGISRDRAVRRRGPDPHTRRSPAGLKCRLSARGPPRPPARPALGRGPAGSPLGRASSWGRRGARAPGRG